MYIDRIHTQLIEGIGLVKADDTIGIGTGTGSYFNN